MKLKTQFTVTMLLFGLIVAAIAVSAFFANREVERASRQARTASSIAQGASELSYLANDYLIRREKSQYDRWQAKFESFSKEIASLRSLRRDQQALISAIQADQIRLKEVFDGASSTLLNSSLTRRTAFNPAFFQAAWSGIVAESENLISKASGLAQLVNEQMDRQIKRRTALMYTIVGLFCVFLLTNYFLTYRRVIQSITVLRAGAAVIGAGYLDYAIEEGKRDEIGDLARAFNRMASDLKAATASKTDLEKVVAERERVEQRLFETGERLKALMLAVPVGVSFSDDPTCGRISGNPAVLSQFEMRPEDNLSASASDDAAPGRKVRYLLNGREVDETDLPLQRAVRENRVIPPIELEVELPSGRRWFADASGAPVRNAEGHVIGGLAVTVDVTERKRIEEALKKGQEELEAKVRERTVELARANEALREISSRLLSAQEDERKRIAVELHDTIGSSLAGIKFKVESTMLQLIEPPENVMEALSSLIPIIQDSIEECRRMQSDLRPPVLDDLGLLAALSWFCRRYQTIYAGIKIDIEQEIEEADIPLLLKTVIFRVTQEGLNNISKHSKADRVRLRLQKKSGKIALLIEDNGLGFDLKRALQSERAMRGLGLSGMKERVELSGGAFSVESAAGRGTTIFASWLSE